MYDLANFGLSEMTKCGVEIRKLGKSSDSVEETAQKIARYFFDSLGGRDGTERVCALVRFYLTVPYAKLPSDLRAFADDILGGAEHSPTMKCLTLLGTAGEAPAWNSRLDSVGHKALPLHSEESIGRSPMISQLIGQLGVPVASLLGSGDKLVIDESQHTFNVFHVPDASGSPHIPAQADFVAPFGIKSVIGFGGMLPTGEMFSVIIFSKAHIARDRAELFNTLALNAKIAIMSFDERIFA